MRIGILTFHCAHNYGAVLQCYALQEFLKQQGHEVEIIDYQPDFLLKPYLVWDIRRFIAKNPIRIAKKTITESLTLYKRIARHKAFNHFINKHLQLSSKITDTKIPSGYDAYIMGSDQIWNPKITNGFHQIYFGNLGFPKENRRYITYAASMEATSLTKDAKEFYQKALKNFDCISVRESKLIELLQPLCKKDIEQVLDPTLLVDSSIWDNIAVKPAIKTKYVVVYQVRPNKETLRIAENIAKQINGVVVELVAWLNWKSKKHKYQSASPEEFVGWIKYADCVVTTSFHGTAFSIIFNRPFYTIALNDGNDSRSASLLEKLGLKERLVTVGEKTEYSIIDYMQANQKLKTTQIESTEFLSSSLK